MKTKEAITSFIPSSEIVIPGKHPELNTVEELFEHYRNRTPYFYNRLAVLSFSLDSAEDYGWILEEDYNPSEDSHAQLVEHATFTGAGMCDLASAAVVDASRMLFPAMQWGRMSYDGGTHTLVEASNGRDTYYVDATYGQYNSNYIGKFFYIKEGALEASYMRYRLQQLKPHPDPYEQTITNFIHMGMQERQYRALVKTLL